MTSDIVHGVKLSMLNISRKVFSPNLHSHITFCSHVLQRHLMTSMSTAANEIPEGHVEITEGTVKMIYDQKEAVFYNKVQVLNRDLSIQVIRLYAEVVAKERKEKYEAKLAKFSAGKSQVNREPFPPIEGISVLDALAATGLRSIRYVKEIPGLREIVINDLLEDATKAAAANCRVNNADESKIKIHTQDATMLMYEHRMAAKHFDVIDLDPYGSACPFLDSAVQAVADGGLFCCTCTDTAVLAGTYPEVCFSKYGSVPLKSPFMHEMTLRILLNAIESAATRYGRYIVPWISLSVDFYVRVFVRVYESPLKAKDSCLRRSMVHQSTQSHSYYLQPLATTNAKGTVFHAPLQTAPAVCEETGGNMKIGGPFWSDPIHNQEVVDELLRRVESGIESVEENSTSTTTEKKAEEGAEVLLPFPVPTARRLTGILSSISDELKDVPFYYQLDDLASIVESRCPTHLEFKSALLNAGYRVSHFHHEPMAMKTDAPPSVVWDVMRAFCKKTPPTGSTKKKQSPVAAAILAREPATEISFEIHESLLQTKTKVARFPPNPEANWGPKRRAGRPTKGEEEAVAKKEARQAQKNAVRDERRAEFQKQRQQQLQGSTSGGAEDGAEPAEKKARPDDA